MLFLKHQLFIHLQEFTNIDVSTQGIYTIQIQLKAVELPQENSKLTFQQSSIRSSVKQSFIAQNSSVFSTEPFILKYNNQVISLKNQCALFKPSTFDDQEIIIVFKLLKIQIDNGKIQGSSTQSLGQVIKVGEHVMKGNISQGILQHFQLKSNYPQCINLSFVIFSLPIQLRIGPKKTSINQKSTEQLRKKIKEYRYFSYIICKQMHSRVKDDYPFTLKLPQQFINPKGQDREHSEATQEDFQKYMINFDRYSLDSFRIVEEFQQIGQKNRQNIELFYNNALQGKISYQKQIKAYELSKNKSFQDSIFQTKQTLSQAQRQKKFKKIRALLSQAQKSNEKVLSFKIAEQKQKVSKPIILVQKLYVNDEKQSWNDEQIKPLYIFAHGYQASKYDIRDLKNTFKRVLGRGHYLILSSYTKFMNQNIEQMGIRAANQVLAFINQHLLENKRFKIFMIGHSLGGLILRASLKYFEAYRDNFEAFVSINVPHLGFIKGMSWLINAGLKFHQKMTPSKCLDQLIFKDGSNIQECYLYRLSKQVSLGMFKSIILISSANDGYVPSQSSRLQRIENPKDSRDYFCNRMIEKITQGRVNTIYRFQIDFDIKEKNINSFLGRTAHVSMLGNNSAAEMVLNHCIQVFTK